MIYHENYTNICSVSNLRRQYQARSKNSTGYFNPIQDELKKASRTFEMEWKKQLTTGLKPINFFAMNSYLLKSPNANGSGFVQVETSRTRLILSIQTKRK